MGRRLLIVAVFILAGAVVNVAVAWGIVAWLGVLDNPIYTAESLEVESIDWWAEHAPADFRAVPESILFASPGIGASIVYVMTTSRSLHPLVRESATRLQTGWPAPSMEGACWFGVDNGRGWIYKDALEIGDLYSANSGILPCLGAAYVRVLLPRLAHRAGIEKRVHAHGLRHTHAAQLRVEGVDIGIISKQLGHRSIATTARYLDHIAPQQVIETIRRRSWEPQG